MTKQRTNISSIPCGPLCIRIFCMLSHANLPTHVQSFMQLRRCPTISLHHLSCCERYLCTFTDGPAYVRSDWRLPILNKQLRSNNSMLGDRESLICSLVFKCATWCGHVSPAHTTRVLRVLIRGEVKHLPNDLTNSCHR